MKKMSLSRDFFEGKKKIAVVGLGYVGLPLAVSMAKVFSVIGFDISKKRISQLKKGIDNTGEVDSSLLKKTNISFTSDEKQLSKCHLIIVAVPTPIDKNKKPDLFPILSATKIVGRNLTKGAVIVYESTVYPGLTEEVCIPLLAKKSGLKNPQEFKVGYSPERINPGDKKHTFENIVKVVAGQDEETCTFLAEIYGAVVKAGIHRAPSIKVAEAAKVIENTQRDLNIALMNELSLIFHKMGIDTLEVLEAASTKWNFLPFTPGLVGGHCIGVDPYYLTYKAEALNHHPEVILAGRRINDFMGVYVAREVVKEIIKLKKDLHRAKVGVWGITFKENIPDIRNTRVIDIISELKSYCITPLIHDPLADGEEVERVLGIKLSPLDSFMDMDAIIVAVPHLFYKNMGIKGIVQRLKDPSSCVLADIKGCFSKKEAQKANLIYWRL